MLLNSPARYGNVAMVLHWLMAAAIVFMLVLGKYMHNLPDGDPNKFGIYQLHKSIGLTILALAVARLLWRLVNVVPPLPEHTPLWQWLAARVSHLLLYALMIVIPFSGWAMVSASPLGVPTLWFGMFEVPHIQGLQGLDNQEAIERTFKDRHELLGNVMILLLLAHIAAALKHHFWDRDTVFKRMLPFARVE